MKSRVASIIAGGDGLIVLFSEREGDGEDEDPCSGKKREVLYDVLPLEGRGEREELEAEFGQKEEWHEGADDVEVEEEEYEARKEAGHETDADGAFECGEECEGGAGFQSKSTELTEGVFSDHFSRTEVWEELEEAELEIHEPDKQPEDVA